MTTHDPALQITANRAQLMAWLKDDAPGADFNMGKTIFYAEDKCGTACCIAGAAALMSRGQLGLDYEKTDFFYDANWREVLPSALEFLGLEEDGREEFDHALFCPAMGGGATPAQAAVALQRAFDGKDPWAGDG